MHKFEVSIRKWDRKLGHQTEVEAVEADAVEVTKEGTLLFYDGESVCASAGYPDGEWCKFERLGEDDGPQAGERQDIG